MTSNLDVEARAQQLCEMSTEMFTQIVRQELNGRLDELTTSALARPEVVERWHRVLGQEYRTTSHHLSALPRQVPKEGKSRKHMKLTARKHAIMRRISDTEWLVKKLKANTNEQQRLDAAKNREKRREAAEQRQIEKDQSSFRKEALRRLANRYPDDLRVILEELLTEREHPNSSELAARIRDWML